MSRLKISKLITACQRALDEHGDIKVNVCIDFAGYEYNETITGEANGDTQIKEVGPDKTKVFTIDAYA